jgi:serine protease Do
LNTRPIDCFKTVSEKGTVPFSSPGTGKLGQSPTVLKTRALATFPVLAVGLFWLGWPAAIADDGTKPVQEAALAKPVATSTTAPADTAKQLVSLSKNIPSSTDDLLNLQAAIEQAKEIGLPATVGISIGGTFGSGVIVTEDGYVLTAGHVVGNTPGRDVTIIMPDGKTKVPAKTLGADHDMDSGLVKITKEGKYPHAEMGHSGDLKLGQWCITLGHPNGLKEGRPPVLRAGRVWYARDDAIGTDCAIVGGDSGGPLLDTDGRVIGIHSRISDGIIENFDVPIDTFRDNWDRLAKGEIWGGPEGLYLGIDGETVAQGCRVTGTHPGYPAAKARLAAGDIITHLDGEVVLGMRSLRSMVSKHKIGDEVTLSVLRGEDKLELKIKLDRPQ